MCQSIGIMARQHRDLLVGASAPAISIVSFLKIASEKDLQVFSHDQEGPGPPMTCSR